MDLPRQSSSHMFVNIGPDARKSASLSRGSNPTVPCASSTSRENASTTRTAPSALNGNSAPEMPWRPFTSTTLAAILSQLTRVWVAPCSRTASASSWASSRSEEHTSELQSLMRISYADFCLKKKKPHTYKHVTPQTHD